MNSEFHNIFHKENVKKFRKKTEIPVETHLSLFLRYIYNIPGKVFCFIEASSTLNIALITASTVGWIQLFNNSKKQNNKIKIFIFRSIQEMVESPLIFHF